MIDVFVGIVLLIGAGFTVVTAIGLLRFPDLYTRTHAASKAGTLGSGLMLVAIGIHSGDSAVFLRAVAGVVFFLLTAPIAAHLLARAAYCTGLQPWSGTVSDDLAGQYDEDTLRLSSTESGGQS